jgi:hypothetical protein
MCCRSSGVAAVVDAATLPQAIDTRPAAEHNQFAPVAQVDQGVGMRFFPVLGIAILALLSVAIACGGDVEDAVPTASPEAGPESELTPSPEPSPSPSPEPAPSQAESQAPPAPSGPPGPVAGATYTGPHSGGGTVTFVVPADGRSVTPFNAAGLDPVCGVEELNIFERVPIENNAFVGQVGGIHLSGSFPTRGTAQGTIQLADYCTLSWSAATSVPVP